MAKESKTMAATKLIQVMMDNKLPHGKLDPELQEAFLAADPLHLEFEVGENKWQKILNSKYTPQDETVHRVRPDCVELKTVDTSTTTTKKKVSKKNTRITKLPEVRQGLTKRVDACNFTYYLTVNFVDERPMEIFITIAKEGSAISGFIEALAITVSIALQHGTPWKTLSEKFSNQTFEPRDDKNSSLIHSISEEVNELVDIWEKITDATDKEKS